MRQFPFPFMVVAALLGCGAPPPPSLDAQRVAVESLGDPTQTGWWRYLAGDAEGAAAAFAGAPTALGALGRARLALDALNPEQALVEAASATLADGLAGAVARGWLAEAVDGLRDGEKLLKSVPLRGGDRVLVAPERHTIRLSFLPWLHLPRWAQTPPHLEGDRLQAQGRSWALETEAAQPDVDGLVASLWPLPIGVAELELEVGGPALAWRGERLVAATDPTRHGPHTLRFPAPGEGPLVVVWAAASPPRLWTHPTPPGTGDDLPGPVVADRSPGIDWLSRYLAVEVALLDGDAETAEIRLADAPPTPAFAMQRARLSELQPGLPTATARDEAGAAWQVAEAFAPARAHLALGQLAYRRGLPDEARLHLQQVLALAPQAFEAHHTLMRLHLTEGQADEAARSLDAARRAAPNPCKLLDDQAALGQPGAEVALRAAYVACGRPLDAALRLLDQARPKDALALLDGLQPTELKTKKAQRLRARALVGVGRLADAEAAFNAAGDLDSALAAADLAGGPTLEATLRALIQRYPTEHQALELVAAQPDRLGLDATCPDGPCALLLDTEAAIAAFRAEPPQSGPAVRVLDHTVMLFFPNSKSLRWVHEILAIRSREAAEQYGEVGLPNGARLVALYTRKEDGRLLFAEEVAEKESLTLPDLEAGDFVVANYLQPGDNGYLYEAGYLTPRVFFRGVDLPIFRQRFEVFSFDDVPPTAHALGVAPTPIPLQLRALASEGAAAVTVRAGLRFDVQRVPLLPPEGDTPPPGLWLPSVRVGHDVVLADDLAWLRDRALNHRRRTLRFDTWAEKIAGQGPILQQIRRLARAVREGIDDDAGLMQVDVSEALASGQGNRALVLSAALESRQLRHRLMLSRTRVHVPPGPFETIAEFAYPLLAVEVPGENGNKIIWLDPGPERAEPGFVPFTLAGGDALQVWPAAGSDLPEALPPVRQVEDRRQVRIKLHWHADGRLTGEAEDRLEGQEAIVIGHHIARLEPELRPRLMERLLVGVVGAAQVTALEDPTVQDPDGPLVLRYTFVAEPGAALALGLYPIKPASSHAAAPERTTPLDIVLPTDQTVDLVLESDRPFAATPWHGERTVGPHHFALRVQQDDDRLELHAHTVIAGGLVAPEAYVDFAAWARAVEEAERIRLTIEGP